MPKVKVIISTIRYGSNGFKHFGDVFNLPTAKAKELADQGFVKILDETENSDLDLDPDAPAEDTVKEEKTPKKTKELKEEVKTK
ncbi:hypothetical protein [Pedobacter duraquae]|uniref:Uncharacterized protein n=1 Tax=Pedobacter duraquae TaxID=425511 RepID=A0A4R6IIU9_9SPHI|nr:hypothetical protein [Pedobacter duraquae]TDO21893.1 hypothetical protein CLV32_3001 [Pedobacter duraquae]